MTIVMTIDKLDRKQFFLQKTVHVGLVRRLDKFV